MLVVEIMGSTSMVYGMYAIAFVGILNWLASIHSSLIKMLLVLYASRG